MTIYDHGPAHFDAYRDDDSRKLMIQFVMRRHAVNHDVAVNRLRTLDHVGLAYLYLDAVGESGGGATRVDYDPCEVGR
jgi:hypothetical protein